MIADAHLSFMEEMNVRFALEDLKVFNREEDAVQLPDGSGYAGTLNIYHEIHCVVSPPMLPVVTSLQLLAHASFRKWMHTHMYQEHYYPNLDDAQREENRLHSGRTPIKIASLL